MWVAVVKWMSRYDKCSHARCCVTRVFFLLSSDERSSLVTLKLGLRITQGHAADEYGGCDFLLVVCSDICLYSFGLSRRSI